MQSIIFEVTVTGMHSIQIPEAIAVPFLEQGHKIKIRS